MLTNQIAAGIAAVVLAFSGVALTAGDDSANLETESEVAVTTDATVAGTSHTTVHDDDHPTSTTVDDSTSVTIEDSVTVEGSTSDDDDDHGDDDTDDDTDDDSPSTTTPDDSDDRQVVEPGLRTYTVGTAGTVVVDGAVLVGVTTNPGWTVEIDESSSERIKVEFENGDAEAEFELQIEGGLEISLELED